MKFVNKKTAIIIAAIVFVAATSAITVVILKKVNDKSSNKTSTATSLTSDAVVKDFSLATLKSDKYHADSSSVTSLIVYKSSGQSYAVKLSTDKAKLFTKLGKNATDDTDKIQSELDAYMTKKGFSQAKINVYGASNKLRYKTYENSKIVCQLSSDTNDQTGEYGYIYIFGCVNKDDVTKQYNLIKSRLSVAKDINLGKDYAEVYVNENSSDNIKYTVLNVNSSSRHNNYLFAAVDGKWEYLGDMLAGGKEYATEKGSVTPVLKAKIEDSKYKGFLKSNLSY